MSLLSDAKRIQVGNELVQLEDQAKRNLSALSTIKARMTALKNEIVADDAFTADDATEVETKETLIKTAISDLSK